MHYGKETEWHRDGAESHIAVPSANGRGVGAAAAPCWLVCQTLAPSQALASWLTQKSAVPQAVSQVLYHVAEGISMLPRSSEQQCPYRLKIFSLFTSSKRVTLVNTFTNIDNKNNERTRTARHNTSNAWKERMATVKGKCKTDMRALSCKIIHWTVHCWCYLTVLLMLQWKKPCIK